MRISDWSSDVCSSDLIRWRHKARTDHPMSSHIRQPLRVGHVGLAARHVLHMLSVDQPQRRGAVLQPVQDGQPIDTGGLTTPQTHRALSKTVTKFPHPFPPPQERGLINIDRGYQNQKSA